MLGISYLLLAGSVLACRSAPVRTYESRPGSYDRIEQADFERVHAARSALERGDARTAQSILAGLSERLPENVPVGALLQDVRLQLASSLPEAARAEVEYELAERHRARAEREPQPAWLVLAARVEPDRLAAERLLERSLEIDQDCLWGHYGLAYLRAQAAEFPAARESLDRALALDPGHLRARRLEINLLARAGDAEGAAAALQAWLADVVDERGRADPFLGRTAVLGARVDLATLFLVTGDTELATFELESLNSGDRGRALSDRDRTRAALVRAAAYFALHDPELAYRWARRAAGLSPDGALSLVQQALILELELDDPEGAREAWEAAAKRLAESPSSGRDGGDLSFLLLLVRARVHAERLAAAAPNR